ncbi:MAG: nucleotide exchange factor GrpE [Anaerolineae bacterium]|nr:nucleotide exchange factor GrpE [Anaerolineae bacterium]
MDRTIRIPVKVRSGMEQPVIQTHDDQKPELDDLAEPIVTEARAAVSSSRRGVQERPPAPTAPDAQAVQQADGGQVQAEQAESQDWRDRALRLQAEMDNYRKRQQRLAEDRIDAERQRLLRSFLPVVDDLERALAAPPGDGHRLREGVQLTHRAALQLLQREGVEPLREHNQPFDPHWHEAVATVDHARAGVAPNTIVEVLEPGYRQQDQLLRPARVVVAV